MAMNEDSVVSSLNELRRMANERSRREAEARARLEAERRAWEDRNRTNRHGETRSRGAEARQDAKTHTMTYGFPEATIQVEGYGQVGQTIGQWQPAPAQTQTLAIAPSPQPLVETQTSRMSAAEWAAREEAPVPAAPQPVRRRSAAGPVLATLFLCGLAGAAGYVKLQQENGAKLKEMQAASGKLEEAKNQAVEAAARAEAQMRVQASTYEQRIKMLSGGRGAAAAGAGTASGGEGVGAPPVAGMGRMPAGGRGAGAGAGMDTSNVNGGGGGNGNGNGMMAGKPSTAGMAGAPRGVKSRRWWRSRAWSKRAAAAQSAAAAAAAAAAPIDEGKKAPLPKIARKKKLNDDPLDGLKL
jgi:hypothetical protein